MSSAEVRFEPLTAPFVDAAAQCLCEQFSAREPCARALRLSTSDLGPFVALLCRQSPSEGLSTIAVDERTGALLGCLIAEDFTTPLTAEMEAATRFMAPSLAMLNLLRVDVPELRDASLGTIVYVPLITSCIGGQGIGTGLLARTLELARARGFKKVLAEVTGKVSQDLFARKFGHAVRAEVRYADFVYEGRHVFREIDDAPSCQLTFGDL